MEKMRLGKTNMMVSRLGFGGIPIQRISAEDAIAVVKRCLDLGITYLDTANGYTTSEERIGKAIAGRRDGIFLATKSHTTNRETLDKDLNLSLKRLGVGYIDLYQFHDIHDLKSLDTILDPSGPLALLEDYKRRGIVKHIGFSSHTMDVAKQAVESDRFETVLFGLNFISSEAADELLPLARKHDVGFIAMKPLGGGMINNATVAIKYLLQFPDILVIPGIERIAEIDELAGILNGPWQMTEAEQLEMQRIKAELGTHFCHRCDYCQPCSSDIPISTVMNIKSFVKRLPSQAVFSGRYAEAMEKAADCIECGECEARCPYHLPIIEMIAEHRQWYEGKRLEYQEWTAKQKSAD